MAVDMFAQDGLIGISADIITGINKQFRIVIEYDIIEFKKKYSYYQMQETEEIFNNFMRIERGVKKEIAGKVLKELGVET